MMLTTPLAPPRRRAALTMRAAAADLLCRVADRLDPLPLWPQRMPPPQGAPLIPGVWIMPDAEAESEQARALAQARQSWGLATQATAPALPPGGDDGGHDDDAVLAELARREACADFELDLLDTVHGGGCVRRGASVHHYHPWIVYSLCLHPDAAHQGLWVRMVCPHCAASDYITLTGARAIVAADADRYDPYRVLGLAPGDDGRPLLPADLIARVEAQL